MPTSTSTQSDHLSCSSEERSEPAGRAPRSETTERRGVLPGLPGGPGLGEPEPVISDLDQWVVAGRDLAWRLPVIGPVIAENRLSCRSGGESSVRESDLDAGAAEVDHRDECVGGVKAICPV